MAYFESDVPKQIQDVLRHLLHVGRNFSGRVAVEQHHIDIAEWIELAASVSAQRDQCQRTLRLPDCIGCGGNNVSQNYVDQLATPGADFAAASACRIVTRSMSSRLCTPCGTMLRSICCNAAGNCNSPGNSFTVTMLFRARTTAYSIVFCSSRTFPGHE